MILSHLADDAAGTPGLPSPVTMAIHSLVASFLDSSALEDYGSKPPYPYPPTYPSRSSHLTPAAADLALTGVYGGGVTWPPGGDLELWSYFSGPPHPLTATGAGPQPVGWNAPVLTTGFGWRVENSAQVDWVVTAPSPDGDDAGGFGWRDSGTGTLLAAVSGVQGATAGGGLTMTCWPGNFYLVLTAGSYYVNYWLTQALTGQAAFPTVPGLWLALIDGGSTELTGGTYSRQPVTFSAASGGSCALSSAVTFGPGTTPPDQAYLYDDPTGGNLLAFWSTGPALHLAPGDLIITLV